MPLGAKGDEIDSRAILGDTDIELIVLQIEAGAKGHHVLKYPAHDGQDVSALRPVFPVGLLNLVFIVGSEIGLVQHLHKVQADFVPQLRGTHLEGDEGDSAIKQRNDIQKTIRDCA